MNFKAKLNAAFNSITANGGIVELHLDVESPYLLGGGQGFAYGLIIRQGDTEIFSEAVLAKEDMVTIAGSDDPRTKFVRENVIPAFVGMEFEEVNTSLELRARWWTTWITLKAKVLELNGINPWETTKVRQALVVVYDNGAPVETCFVAQAQEDQVQSAGDYTDGVLFGIELAGPYAPLDIMSELAVRGYNPDITRSEAAEALGVSGAKHNPMVDVRQSMAVLDAARTANPALDAYKI